jgi:hypothetical protein
MRLVWRINHVGPQTVRRINFRRSVIFFPSSVAAGIFTFAAARRIEAQPRLPHSELASGVEIGIRKSRHRQSHAPLAFSRHQ